MSKAMLGAHLTDLISVDPEAGRIFVCPLCLRIFSEQQALNTDLVDRGHVWPAGIRSRGAGSLAGRQIVLLCKQCNSTSGSRGDKQMQLLDRIRQGERTGEVYGKRRIQVHQPNERPIQLDANVRETDSAITQIAYRPDRVNPVERERFQDLLKRSEIFNVRIPPHHKLRPALARAGWITSAFLLAFYTFGYRYVLLDALTPVQQYILDSFASDKPDEIAIPESAEFDALLCDTCFSPDPEIALVVPIDGEKQAHLRVNFLNYHVDLPFRGSEEVLESLIHSSMPDLEREGPKLAQQGVMLYAPIVCTKMRPHDCLWDKILGKPLSAR